MSDQQDQPDVQRAVSGLRPLSRSVRQESAAFGVAAVAKSYMSRMPPVYDCVACTQHRWDMQASTDHSCRAAIDGAQQGGIPIYDYLPVQVGSRPAQPLWPSDPPHPAGADRHGTASPPHGSTPRAPAVPAQLYWVSHETQCDAPALHALQSRWHTPGWHTYLCGLAAAVGLESRLKPRHLAGVGAAHCMHSAPHLAAWCLQELVCLLAKVLQSKRKPSSALLQTAWENPCMLHVAQVQCHPAAHLKACFRLGCQLRSHIACAAGNCSEAPAAQCLISVSMADAMVKKIGDTACGGFFVTVYMQRARQMTSNACMQSGHTLKQP